MHRDGMETFFVLLLAAEPHVVEILQKLGSPDEYHTTVFFYFPDRSLVLINYK